MAATVDAALQAARAAGLDRLDAQILLLHTLGRDPHDRAWLLAHDTDPLPPDLAQRYAALWQRRQSGEPVAYLIGQREFHGLLLHIDARVLDPRPDTETLVDWALDVLADLSAPNVIDLGTGSGAIALALQHRRPDAQVWAVDASPDALNVAHGNAQQLQLPVRFLQGHWLSQLQPYPSASAELPTARNDLDLIVSNPPYIRADDPHLAALTHEPLQALASGADGLDDIRQIVIQAPKWLRAGGWLLLEHGWDQACDVRALLEQAGFGDVQSRHDLSGIERCSGGRWPGVA